MQYVCSSAAALAASVWMVSGAFAQNLSIINYRLVSEERVTRSESYFTYRADLMNTGPSRAAVTATVASNAPNVRTVAGQTNIHFSPVPASGMAPGLDTFTLLIDRSVPFDYSQIQWSFTAPVANAGLNQTSPVGATVALNGSGSTNPSGVGQLSYAWAIVSRPPASKNQIGNATNPVASFTVDAPGTYVFRLAVSNGAGTDSATVSVSTRNSAPVANAGPDQTVPPGSLVRLDGGVSSDVDGDPLTYSWQLISVPPGSAATLSGASIVQPTFVADKPGRYIARLIVNDGLLTSGESTVTVTTSNTRPVANAGPDQQVLTGVLVQLNGTGSTDVDRDPLTYRWTLHTVPPGSTAALNNLTIVNPVFTADKAGDYVAQLVVNDGNADSDADTVRITTTAPLAPSAHAGLDKSVPRGATVTLNGSGTDPQNLPLSYSWSLTTKPTGSTAALTAANTATPAFVADVRGRYVAQLIVSNGHQSSPPDSVNIDTENTKPVANPGANQNVVTGNTVLLNGSASSDADGDTLTYSWSFLSKPDASAATLTGANTVTPSFLADAGGIYVVQLIVRDGLEQSAPVTVTIAANTLTLDLAPNPLNLSNAPKTLTVTVSPPAPAGGVLVRFAILDPAVASAPAEVLVPAGATGANIQVTPAGAGNTTIMASAPGYRPAVGNISVMVPSITLTLADPVVGLSRSIVGTVTLSDAVPPSGVTVAINANPPDKVTLEPSLVVIPGGSTTGTFQITGTAEGTALIAATASGYTGASVTIKVQPLGAIVLQSGVSVGPGQSVPIQVSLVTPAPVGGVTVSLSSSDTTKATVTPAVVEIAYRATTPLSQPTVNGVTFGSVIVSATASGFKDASQPVQIRGVLAFSPAVVIAGAGGTHNLNLTLSSPAPSGGLLVNLTSGDPSIATVPATVTIPANQSNFIVPMNALAKGNTTISATANAPNVVAGSAEVSVVVFGDVVLPAAPTVALGGSVPFPISLSENAPAGGVTVSLAVTDPAKASLTTTTVPIPAGAKVPAQQPQLAGLAPGTATVNASAPGFGTASTVVQVTATLSFTSGSVSVNAGSTQTATLNLSGPAPAGGLIITLHSSDTAIATVPPSVTILAGATSAGVLVTGVGPGSAIIRATHPALTQVQAEVTVQPNGPIGLPGAMTLAPGQTVPFAVTLPVAAPAGGVTVALNSSDSSKVNLSTTTVQILAGQTAPATPVSVTSGSFGSATITATAPNYATNSTTITVGASLSFPPGPLNMLSGAAQNVNLTLSAAAPAGGLSVTLRSSNSAVASVPSSVTIPAGANSVSVAIQAGVTGTAEITASSGASTVTGATLTVAVPPLAGAIGGPALLTVPLGQTAPLLVMLPAQAPLGGVSLSVISSDPTVATVASATAVVPAGQSQPSPTIQVSGVKPGTTSITISAAGYGPLTVPVRVTATLAFDPTALSVATKETKSLVLRLSAPAPAAGLTVELASANPAIATVPATAFFAGGSASANVPVTGVAPGTVSVMASGTELTAATATVTVIQSVDIIVPQNLTVAPGESIPFPIALAAPPAGTTRVDLQVSDATKARLTFTSVFIDPGQTQPLSSPRIEGLAPGDVTVTALSNGLSSALSSVRVGYTISFAQPAIQVSRGTTLQAGLRLSGAAPAGGLQIALSADNAGVATVPATVSFAGGTSSVNVPVTGAGVGNTIVRANGAGLTEAPLSVTVTEPGSIVMPSLTTVHLNSTAEFAFTLSSPAPAGGVDVTLSSSDSAILSVSAPTIHVPGGSSSVTIAPTVTGVNVGDATITASAPGYLTATKVVKVNATIAFLEPNVTFAAGTKKMMALRLSTGAPQGGITINLSSSNTSVITTPATTNFYWDGSDPSIVLFQIDGVATGTAQLRASGINIPEVVANIVITGQLSIATGSLPNGRVNAEYNDGGGLVASGGTAPYTFTLTGGTLPPNLSLNPNGRITGTPSSVTAASLTFRVTDSSTPAQTATAILSLTIVQDPPDSIVATSGGEQTAKIRAAFGARLAATVKDASNRPLPNVLVTFVAPASGASATFAGGNTATTDASGIATSNLLTANSVAGSYSITARVDGLPATAAYLLTNTPGDPASVAATAGTSQTAKINTAFGARLQATVRDEGNNLVPGAQVTFTIVPASGSGGTFSGPNVVTTDQSGVALSPVLTANEKAGTFSVTAAVPNVQTVAAFSLTIEAGPPASIETTGGSGQSAPIDTLFANPITAVVRDAGRNPLQGVTVTFAAPASGASATFPNGLTAVTGSGSGTVSVPVRANGTAGGPYVVTASVAGVETSAQITLTNVVVPVATLLIADGGGQTAQIDTAFGKRLAVTARDAAGNLVKGASVTFTLPSSGAGGTFAGGVSTAVTDDSGVATSAVLTANSTAGVWSVTASANGKTAVFSLTNMGPPVSMTPVAGSTPQIAEVLQPFAAALAVTVRDSGGNAVPNVNVTFTAPATGATGTFAGSSTVATGANGVATAPVFTANQLLGPYTVQASGAGLTADFALTNKEGRAQTLTASGGGGQSVTVGTSFPNALRVTVTDKYGNPVSGATVLFSAPATGASCSFAGGNTAITDAAGLATSTVVTANALTGQYVVTAQVAGVASSASFTLTNVRHPGSVSTAPGSTPQDAEVDSNFGVALAAVVRDVSGNLMPDVAVTFRAPSSGASGGFNGSGPTSTVNTNAQGIATTPIFRANTIAGTYAVTAEVTGLAQKADYLLTNVPGPPAAVTAVSGGGQSAFVNTAFAAPLVARVVDKWQNPVRSVPVTFRVPSDPGVASAVFDGSNVALTNGSGIATSAPLSANGTPGKDYIVTANVTGLPPASFTLTNNRDDGTPPPLLTVASADVGKGLQVPIQVRIPIPIATDVEVTVTSLDSSRVLLSKSSAVAGSGSLVLPIAAGQTAVTIFAQALANSSTVNVSAAASGYTTGTGAITLGPSGLVLAGPNGIGVPSFATTEGSTVTVTIHAALLNTSGGVVATQATRGGANVAVGLTALPSSVGTMQPATATILSGDSSVTATFRALKTGAATITASNSEFAQGTLVANVGLPSCIMPAVTVGRNLQTTAQAELTTVASSTMPVLITSADPSKLLLSKTATDAGSASISVNIPLGGFRTPPFYLQALSDTGPVEVVATCGTVGSATGVVTLAKSGFTLSGTMVGLTEGSPNVLLSVSSVMLDSSLNFVDYQPIRAGFSTSVSVTSSDTTVGSITSSPVTLSGNVGFGFTQFDPLKNGTTLLSIDTPAGFSTPAQGTSLTAQIGVATITLDPLGPTIGKNLQQLVTIGLGQAAPSGGVAVTVGTASPSLRIGVTPDSAGSASIVINVPAGGFQATVYLNALADIGSAAYTVSAPGYVTKQDTVQFAPSGVVIYGPFGLGWPLYATVGGNNQVIADVGVVDALSGTWMYMPQPVRGGLSLTAPLSSSNTNIGTVPAQVVIPSGASQAIVNFTAKAAGQTTIEVTQPTGLSPPSQYTSLIAQVN